LENGNVGDRRSTCQIQIDVVDTGIGISTEQIARLFQPFLQADASQFLAGEGTSSTTSV